MTATPLGDIIAEADRMLAAAHERNVRVRLIGGLAVYFHADHVHPALARPYGDIDVATTKAEGRDLTELMTDLGYEPARQFNALHGSRRLLFRLAAALLGEVRDGVPDVAAVGDEVAVGGEHEQGLARPQVAGFQPPGQGGMVHSVGHRVAS